jgi:membrane protein
MTISAILGLLKDSYREWNDDKVPRLGAALACYTVFSLAPLLVVVLAVTGLVFGPSAAQQLTREISDTVGQPVGQAIGSMIREGSHPATGGWAAVLGISTLLFGCTGVFVELQDSLNTIWKVAPKPGRGLWGIVRDRFLSLAMVCGICFLLLVSLVVTAGLASAARLWTPGALAGWGAFLVYVLNELVAFLVVTGLFALVYKYLPDAEIRWSDVGLGAALTALLFTVGKYLLGTYLANDSVTTGYGAAGSLVLIVFWVYYSSQIFLFGAELTRVYADRFGHGVQPSVNAEFLSPETQARQGLKPEAQARIC